MPKKPCQNSMFLEHPEKWIANVACQLSHIIGNRHNCHSQPFILPQSTGKPLQLQSQITGLSILSEYLDHIVDALKTQFDKVQNLLHNLRVMLQFYTTPWNPSKSCLVYIMHKLTWSSCLQVLKSGACAHTLIWARPSSWGLLELEPPPQWVFPQYTWQAGSVKDRQNSEQCHITKDLIDKVRVQYNNFATIKALRNFRESIDIQDAWQHDNSNTRTFAFTSSMQFISQLDKIYVQRCLTQYLSS